MNTLDIIKILGNNKNAKQSFHGVYPADMLPEIHSYPASLVINLDPSTLPGSHWVVLYFSKAGTCEYFDSYGQEPPKQIKKYITRYARHYTYNNLQVQDFATVSCGHMCIYYIVFRSKGFAAKYIILSMLQENIYKYFRNNLEI